MLRRPDRVKARLLGGPCRVQEERRVRIAGDERNKYPDLHGGSSGAVRAAPTHGAIRRTRVSAQRTADRGQPVGPAAVRQVEGQDQRPELVLGTGGEGSS